jgi:CDP-2,3-bis-(O-geranylgeranyl)-sn-glycerol synthase
MALPLDPGACALFLMATFVLSGIAQVTWLASPVSHAFAVPIDRGRTFRGRRLLGDNKTLRGFLVMVPASACAFVLVSQIAMGGNPEAFGLWRLTGLQYALLGAWAGLGFMLGELPNSFVKRQLDIEPGRLTTNRAAAVWQLAADRVDSGLGMLIAIALVVPLPWQTWGLVLLLGWSLHWGFSVLLFRLDVKPRAA